MNSNIVKEVEKRADGLCEWCGRHVNASGTYHHVIGGNGKRRSCETVESVIYICHDCHTGKYGAHGTMGRGTQDQMKFELQSYYFKNYTEDEVREKMGGKLYLHKGEIVKDRYCRWMNI
jgi:ribosome-binding protein aMBF1 (putative translation factor)